MTPRLSLDCLTLTATPPPEVVRSAAAAGYDLVSLWAQPPAAYDAALMTPAHEAECRRVMADTGVALFSLEVFNLVSTEANESYRPALELGARLGAKAALAFTTRSSVSARWSDRYAITGITEHSVLNSSGLLTLACCAP